MDRVVILGRGGAGKSVAAQRLSQATGLPVRELDQHFWSADLVALDRQEWVRVQEDLAAASCWIMDGDLGPYDVVAPRLRQADTVVVLDFSLPRCVWRVLRRGPQRRDFWWWVLFWRHRGRKQLLRELAQHSEHAQLHVLNTPHQLEAFLAAATDRGDPQ